MADGNGRRDTQRLFDPHARSHVRDSGRAGSHTAQTDRQPDRRPRHHTRRDRRRARARGAIDASTVAVQIIELAEAHAAFPVLHYLHTTDERRSAPAMIANLALAISHTSPDTARSMTVISGALQHYLHLHPFAAHATGDVWTWIRRDDGREP